EDQRFHCSKKRKGKLPIMLKNSYRHVAIFSTATKGPRPRRKSTTPTFANRGNADARCKCVLGCDAPADGSVVSLRPLPREYSHTPTVRYCQIDRPPNR